MDSNKWQEKCIFLVLINNKQAERLNAQLILVILLGRHV